MSFSVLRRRAFAQVVGDLSDVVSRIQGCHHIGPIQAFPDTDVERNAFGRTLHGVRATDFGGGLPGELLSRETLDAAVSQDAGERSGKTEAVRQHEFLAGLAELMTEEFLSVENLADQ